MRTLITISSLVLAFAAGWNYRNNSAELEITNMQLSQLKAYSTARSAIVSLEAKRQTALAENDKLFAQLKSEQARKNKTITKQVIRYVESTIDNQQCDLPTGWVQYHNAAATSSMPEHTNTTGGANDTASGVTTARALVTITDNYQSCNDIRLRMLELQAWAREVSREH